MAYERGTGTVEVELARLQSWVETADPELNGKDGKLGMIRQFHDEHAEREGLRKFIKSIFKWVLFINGGTAILVALHELGLLK